MAPLRVRAASASAMLARPIDCGDSDGPETRSAHYYAQRALRSYVSLLTGVPGPNSGPVRPNQGVHDRSVANTARWLDRRRNLRRLTAGTARQAAALLVEHPRNSALFLRARRDETPRTERKLCSASTFRRVEPICLR
jgi:hypothetical protein